MLPFYTKAVRAGKITGIEPYPNGSFRINCGNDSFDVERDWMQKYNPSIGGYFVIRPGDYAHYSPASVFEEKYKKSAP